MLRKIALICLITLTLTACGEGDDYGGRSATGTVAVSDVYSFAVPSGAPVGAVFMTVDNQSGADDRMVDFKSDYASKIELHTMAMEGDIMRMRQVMNYTIPAGGTHVLEPGGDHIMLYGVNNPLPAGSTFEAIAVFEQAGEVPVTVEIRARN